VAYVRRVLVEKAGKGLEEAARRRTALESLATGRLRATSIVKGFADAIVWLLVARWLKRGGLEVWKRERRCRTRTNAFAVIG
jgi:hypothetical protein